LLYLTDRENYAEKIREMTRSLEQTLPQICAYFNMPEITAILKELKKYDKDVSSHEQEFREVRRIWSAVMRFLRSQSLEA
jgi:hypothetical protein